MPAGKSMSPGQHRLNKAGEPVAERAAVRVVLKALPDQGKPGVLYAIAQLAGIAAVTPNEPATTYQGTFLTEAVEREVFTA